MQFIEEHLKIRLTDDLIDCAFSAFALHVDKLKDDTHPIFVYVQGVTDNF